MPTSVEHSLESIQAAMKETNDLFNFEVFGKRNFDALDHVYTLDATILPPGAQVIVGRDPIKEFWKSMIVGANAKAAVLSSLDVMPAGDGVVEVGTATLTVQPEGETEAQMAVKYVVYWRQEAGRWKWHVDIWNSN